MVIMIFPNIIYANHFFEILAVITQRLYFFQMRLKNIYYFNTYLKNVLIVFSNNWF